MYAERAFALFLAGLAEHAETLTIVGRMSPDAGRSHYRLPRGVRFVELPHYESLSRPGAVLGSLMRSLGRFWRALDDGDHVWLLGPYPHALAFAVLTRLRGRRLVLGVRQDFPVYVRSRRPGQRWMHLAADVLELQWRLIARRVPVVVVGAELARKYARTPALLDVTVALITEADIEAGLAAAARSYEGPLTVLSVGRLDREKNPLLLAQIFAQLTARDDRWQLIICGEGPLAEELGDRLWASGTGERVTIRGYVPLHGGLLDLYRQSHVFLHVSLTEGRPQVLTEAFASGLPVVATGVGGVPEAARDAALLIPPEDAGAAVEAIVRIAEDPALRTRLIAAGLVTAKGATLEAETRRVARFIAGLDPEEISDAIAERPAGGGSPG